MKCGLKQTIDMITISGIQFRQRPTFCGVCPAPDGTELVVVEKIK